jgi:uncharacterized protein with HEPN domain
MSIWSPNRFTIQCFALRLSEIAPVPSERIAKSLRDILGAIQLIRAWTADAGGVDAAVFRNPLVRSAIERQLLIVSEASIRIDHENPAFAPTHAPEIDWSGVRGIGNVLRHRYDDLDTRTIVGVLNNRLDPLEAACTRLLEA